MRDRSTYAMGFTGAFVMDVFKELSRSFLHAVCAGEVTNPADISAETTVRLDDIYHLHTLAREAHSALARAVGAICEGQRAALQWSSGSCAVTAIATMIAVHLAFYGCFVGTDAALSLSAAIAEAGGCDCVPFSTGAQPGVCSTAAATLVAGPVIVSLEITNASWPREWLQPYLFMLQEATLEARERVKQRNKELELQRKSGNVSNLTSAYSLGSVILPRAADTITTMADWIFPTPRFEVMCGNYSEALLEVRSLKLRAALGVKVVNLRLSARDPIYFGESHALRELFSLMWLYDAYVLYSLPLHAQRHQRRVFGGGRSGAVADEDDTAMTGDAVAEDGATDAATPQDASAPTMRVLMPGHAHSIDPTQAGRPSGFVGLMARCRFAAQTLMMGATAAMLLSAFLRRLLVLSARVSIYYSYTVRQVRRFAFIAEQMRRVNYYSPTELLELWTAWVVCVCVAALLLWSAFSRGASWLGILVCYAFADYWGVVHVRTKQSRWFFPRVVALVYGGTLLYASWWPLCSWWLVLWALGSAQLLLMAVLMCQFDCFVTLPEHAPHRVLCRSLLMPAARVACAAASPAAAPVPPAGAAAAAGPSVPPART